MQTHNLVDAIKDLGAVEFKELATFNRGSLGVYWAVGGVSPWERHPEDDELLYVFEGRVTVEILTEDDRIEVPVTEGSAFVVPRNHWHRHILEGTVKEMYVTPGPSDTSFADDPRSESDVG